MNLETKLTGDRVFLREMEESDISEDFICWLEDPAVNEFLEVRHNVPNIEKQIEYLNACKVSLNKMYLGIFLQDSTLIGSATLTRHKENSIEIGLMIGDKASQGKGIGREVVEIVIRWAKSANYDEITAGYLNSNVRSANLFDSLGFQINQKALLSDRVIQDSPAVRTSLYLKA